MAQMRTRCAAGLKLLTPNNARPSKKTRMRSADEGTHGKARRSWKNAATGPSSAATHGTAHGRQLGRRLGATRFQQPERSLHLRRAQPGGLVIDPVPGGRATDLYMAITGNPHPADRCPSRNEPLRKAANPPNHPQAPIMNTALSPLLRRLHRWVALVPHPVFAIIHSLGGVSCPQAAVRSRGAQITPTEGPAIATALARIDPQGLAASVVSRPTGSLVLQSRARTDPAAASTPQAALPTPTTGADFFAIVRPAQNLLLGLGIVVEIAAIR